MKASMCIHEEDKSTILDELNMVGMCGWSVSYADHWSTPSLPLLFFPDRLCR